jgi:RNA polymerase sigma-70 factor (sigma-E family)
LPETLVAGEIGRDSTSFKAGQQVASPEGVNTCRHRGNVEPHSSVPLLMTVPIDSPPVDSPWDGALVELYEQHYDQLVRLAYLVSGRASAAEEVVQDAFIKTHRSWNEVRDPVPYLRTAVVNGCRSWGRRQKLEQTRQPRPPEPVRQEPDELWDALATLNDRARTAIVLRFYADLPDAEIAEILGCRVPTVRTTIHRAFAALRREIDR